MKKLAVAIFIVFLVASCSRGPWVIKSYPPVQKIDNSLYTIQLTPSEVDRYSYTAFDLTIKNKTDKDIELEWDRTYYLQSGQTNGGFMFEGIIERDRNNPKPPDIIMAQTIFSKTIYPNFLTVYRVTPAGTIIWRHDSFTNGENGIYLSLKVKGKEIREKLTVNTFASYDESQRHKTGWGKLINKE